MSAGGRVRRWAETGVILGLCLTAMSTASWAQGGGSAPAPVAAEPTPAAPRPAPAGEVAQDTLVICHATGDPAVPYEELTISDDGLSPHFDHENDLIPAPSGGCGPGGGGDDDEPVLACHATGDPEAPFELLVLVPSQVDDHAGHPDDLVPAPGDTCPGQEDTAVPGVPAAPVVTPGPSAAPTATATPVPAAPDPRPRPGGPDGDEAGAVAPVSGGAPAGGAPSGAVPPAAPPPQASVAGEISQSVDAGAAAARAGDLPFTGRDLHLLFAVGLGLAMTGCGLRLLSAPAPPITS